jgi:hypothetical protein
MNPRPFLIVPLLAVTVGCMTERRSYQVAVENKLDHPISFWLVKEHGPMESGWISPEQLATEVNPPGDDNLPAVVVPPGKTASTRGPIEGDFDKDRGKALVRVYAGTPTLTQTLAIGRGSLSRLDVPLQPGVNHLLVQDNNGMMEAVKQPLPQRAPEPPPQQVSKY